MSQLEITRPDLTTDQTREYQTRATAETGKREIVGIGVPLGEEIEVYPGFREMFDPGCEFENLERAKLAYRHGEIIGTIPTAERSADAMNIVSKVSKTQRGDEALELARDGALDSFSIGFRPIEWRETEDGLVVYTKVRVREFSLVPDPAYPTATVTEIRHSQTRPTREETPMPDTMTREELEQELETREADQRREIESMLAQFREQLDSTDAPTYGTQWRTAGDFMKAVARAEDAALEFHRAYTGATFADTAQPATWIKDAIKLIEQRRPQISSFTRAPLPAEGMTLDYLKLKSDTMLVARQVNEGDDLDYGEVQLEADNVPVHTYGGYYQLTRQAIERASSVYLNTASTASDLAFAKATELAFKATLYAVVSEQIGDGNSLTLANDADVFDWLDLIVDAADLADDRGFQVAGLKVSKEIFKRIYRIADSNGDPLLGITGNGVNRAGTIRASQIRADLADIPVEVVAGAAASFATFYDPVALTTWEQPGAPVKLQDENVINLSKTFSKYGYLAFGSQFPTALIPVQVGNLISGGDES